MDRIELIKAVAGERALASGDPTSIAQYFATAANTQPVLARMTWVGTAGVIRASTDPSVLVIDDDDTIRSFAQIVLEDEGYEVQIAVDGYQALKLVEKRPPVLILLDMRMPRMNGWEFVAAYRQLPGPHVPIIVMTAGRETELKAVNIGASDYIMKPYDLDQLLNLVEKHMPPK